MSTRPLACEPDPEDLGTALRRIRPTTGRSTSPNLAVAAARSRWRAWGTTVTLIVRPARALPSARRIVQQEMTAFDAACNRLRADSEIRLLSETSGRPEVVSCLLFEALQTALRAAEITTGAVDPTVGTALSTLGYDSDLDEIDEYTTEPFDTARTPSAGWRSVILDPASHTAAVPEGTLLDVSATAKALCADRAAARIHAMTGSSVVVDIGGDLSSAGPPPAGGWQVAVTEDPDRPKADDPTRCVVALWEGALASSGTSVRTWTRAGWPLHHIIDPATGWSAEPLWRTVTVGARTCVEANTASTAAIVWGGEAPFRLARLGLPARLVSANGAIIEVGGWPALSVGISDVSSAS